jgi:hypothetical protein
MGHINFDNIVKVNKKEEIREIPKISKPTNILCKHYYRENKPKIIQVKGVLNKKTTGDCTYRSSWTDKNKRIERSIVIHATS